MKGIVLAGGSGSRLYPLTSVITKQLQPIYDKPMIYYPLSLLMLCGIREILLISTPKDIEHFRQLLKDGRSLGIKISYAVQAEPKGIAEAYTIAEAFLDGDDSTMILGDNLFHGNFSIFREAIAKHLSKANGFNACIFAYPVADPERYGVVEFDKGTQRVVSIEEKPLKPKSHFAIPGLYIFDGSAPARTKKLIPSERGEIEITDLVKSYLTDGLLRVEMINRGIAWLDTGTPQSFLEASSYIGIVEQRQGLKVACLEEVALRMEFIDIAAFQNLLDSIPKSPYRNYLETIATEFLEK